MADDIVTRLREKYSGQLPICAEAADEIERLRAEVARLNTFLYPIGVVVNQAVRGE